MGTWTLKVAQKGGVGGSEKGGVGGSEKGEVGAVREREYYRTHLTLTRIPLNIW